MSHGIMAAVAASIYTYHDSLGIRVEGHNLMHVHLCIVHVFYQGRYFF